MALDWDILEDEFTSIAAWSDISDGNCTVTQVTEDSRSCAKLYVPAAEPDLYSAQFGQTLSSPGSGTFTLAFTFKQTHFISTEQAYSFCPYGLGWAFALDSEPSLQYRFAVGYDGTNYFFKFYRGASNILLAMIDFDTTAWHTVRIVVEASRVTTVWFDNYCYEVEETYTRTIADFIDWRFNFFLFSWGTDANQAIAYIDWVGIDSTPEHPTTTSPLIINDENIVCRYRQNGGDDGWGGETQYDYFDAEKTRISQDGTKVYSMPLVANDDALRSGARIHDGSAIKSLQLIPS